MDPREILKFCIGKGLLLDQEVLNLFSEAIDEKSAKQIIEELGSQPQKRIITKDTLEKVKIKLGLQIEISRQKSEVLSSGPGLSEEIQIQHPEGGAVSQKEETSGVLRKNERVKLLSKPISFKKKIEVGDFVKNFRNRFYEMKSLLQERSELDNLVSINKLSRSQKVSIIGMISSKRVTKNGNLLLEVEDLTGKTRVLINQNRPEIYEKAEEITLDSVIGFSGFGDIEIFFASNVVFPDSLILERKKAPVEEYALFLGDIHYGSNNFLEENFLKFIDYLNGKFPDKPEIEKIKYIFIVGDLVAGVGIHPTQQKELKITDLEMQFEGIAELLKRIRKDITIIISPGNHDGVRLMEPQPLLDEKYAWPLYNMKNVLLTGNPAYVNIGEREDFTGFDVLTYHGFSFPFYANTIPKLMGTSLNNPEKIMTYLLKNRHLAPTHTSNQYIPSEKDELVIKEIPDIFVSAHTHKSSLSYYNNILLVSVSSWEGKTRFQERMGNEPDFCKVPMLNLKNRSIKILDFE